MPLNPKKLLNSKWTAVEPINKEKHFIIIKVATKKDGSINQCQMQAIMTQRKFFIQWQELKDNSRWHAGWK